MQFTRQQPAMEGIENTFSKEKKIKDYKTKG